MLWMPRALELRSYWFLIKRGEMSKWSRIAQLTPIQSFLLERNEKGKMIKT